MREHYLLTHIISGMLPKVILMLHMPLCFLLDMNNKKNMLEEQSFYFKSWMNHTIDYDAKGYTGGVNEMAYYTVLYCIGDDV